MELQGYVDELKRRAEAAEAERDALRKRVETYEGLMRAEAEVRKADRERIAELEREVRKCHMELTRLLTRFENCTIETD